MFLLVSLLLISNERERITLEAGGDLLRTKVDAFGYTHKEIAARLRRTACFTHIGITLRVTFYPLLTYRGQPYGLRLAPCSGYAVTTLIIITILSPTSSRARHRRSKGTIQLSGAMNNTIRRI